MFQNIITQFKRKHGPMAGTKVKTKKELLDEISRLYTDVTRKQGEVCDAMKPIAQNVVDEVFHQYNTVCEYLARARLELIRCGGYDE